MMELTIGFTGTRSGMTIRQRRAFTMLITLATKFRHGNCKGADDNAHYLTESFNPTCRIIHHPSNMKEWQASNRAHEVLPERPPIERNHDIVDLSDMLVAAPSSLIEEQRSGTWATIRYSRKVGKPTIILEP